MPRLSAVVLARGYSSRSSTTLPSGSRTGTSEFEKRPSFCAIAQRRWLSAAKASRSPREKPSSVAIRSAEMPCGTNGCSSTRCGLLPSRPPPVDPIGTRDIDSTPPPITRSCWPAITPIAAKFTACWPEPQKRFRVTPLARLRIPARGEHGVARDAGGLVVDVRDAAGDEVLDVRGIDAGALLRARSGTARAAPADGCRRAPRCPSCPCRAASAPRR